MWTASDRHYSNFSQSFLRAAQLRQLNPSSRGDREHTCLPEDDACCPIPAKLLYWFCLHLSKQHMPASQPAKKCDGWAGTLLLTLLMLQFVVLIQIKSGGFEKCHWYLLTIYCFLQYRVPLLAPLHLFIAWNKKKPKIFSNKSSTFKVYNHTHTT